MTSIKLWSTVMLSLLALGSGCGSGPQDEQELCNARIRLAVLQIWDTTSRKEPVGGERESATSALHDLLDGCAVPVEGIVISGDTSIQPIEIYLLAGVYDEVRSSLNNIEALSQEERSSLLFAAARYGNIGILKAVIESGIDADSRDEMGSNAISSTVGSVPDAEEKIVFLMANGLDPLEKNDDDFSALDAAVLTENVDFIGQILRLVDPDDPHARLAVQDALTIAKATQSGSQIVLEAWLK